jgi:predicted restriction endonuclease
MDTELPEVTGVNVIHVSQDMETDEIKSFMDSWIDEHPEITSDPGQIVIFSPYEMNYDLSEKDGINHLSLQGFMSRTKWATLSDADDLRAFAFQLERNHKNLKVHVVLSLSVKEYEETDESYNFVSAYFAKNQEVRDMIVQMSMDEEYAEYEEDSDEETDDSEELDEDLDSELFGSK